MNARLAMGLIAAALWLPVLLLATSGMYGTFWLTMITPFTVILTLAAAPFAFALRRTLSLTICLAAGSVAGGVGAMAFALMTNSLAGRNWAPLLVGAGFLSGLVFWAVGVRGNRHLMAENMER